MSSLDIQLRPATSQDTSQIHGIYSHYIKTSIATLEETVPTVQQLVSKFNNLTKLNLPYIVAVDSQSGQVAGTAHADYFNERSGYQHTVEDAIYLHLDYCGKGIGKLLLTHLLQTLKTTGKQTVIAKMSILPGQELHQNASCRLHLSLGFREVGRLEKVGQKFGTVVDVVMLQLDLEDLP